MMDNSELEELDHNNFLRIYGLALHALASDPQTACEAMGNDNTPLEIQDELVNYAYLANSETLELDPEQREGMLNLAEELKRLPPEAIAPPGAIMTSHAGCVQAMRHRAWEPLRDQAAVLAELLEPAFDRSEDFLDPD